MIITLKEKEKAFNKGFKEQTEKSIKKMCGIWC